MCGRANVVQMKTRHDNMLHLAHFLHTKTEPRLYYKPWEMTAEEDDRIDDQIAEARATIQRESDEYEDRQEDDSRREQRATPDEATYHSGTNPPTDPAQLRSADNASTQDHDMPDQHAEETVTHPGDAQHTEEPAMDTRSPEPETVDEPVKDADEEVVEAAEDTVIY